MDNRELEELFRAIEEACGFEEIKEISLKTLEEKIAKVLGIHEPEKVQAGREQEDESWQDRENPFFIEKEDGCIIQADSGWKFSGYTAKLKQVAELDEVCERYKEKQEVSAVIRQIDKMREKMREKKVKLSYQRDEDNGRKLAEWIIKNILDKYVRKINDMCWGQTGMENSRREWYLHIIDAVNRYLKKNGVYTIIPKKDTPYEQVIHYYNPPLCDVRDGGRVRPTIESVQRPAYVIDYVDEDGEVNCCCTQGTCTGR